MFTVFFSHTKFFYSTASRPKTANRFSKSKSFKNETEAVAFAKEKIAEGCYDVSIYNNIGHKVNF